MGTSEHVRCNVYRQPGSGRLDTLCIEARANHGDLGVVLYRPWLALCEGHLEPGRDPRLSKQKRAANG